MIQLDTSFLIPALARGSTQDRTLRRWLREGQALAISTIAWAEFICGPVTDEHLVMVSRIIVERVPFGEEEAYLSARLFNDTGRRRGSLVDCMIAATALRSGAT